MSKFTFFQAEICNISALIYKKRPPLNISKVAVLPSSECPVVQHFCMFSYFFCLHPYPRVTFRGFRRALRHGSRHMDGFNPLLSLRTQGLNHIHATLCIPLNIC